MSRTGKTIVFMLSFFLASAATAGEVYKWVDDDGVTHIEDTPHNIPPAYRNKTEMKRMADPPKKSDRDRSLERLDDAITDLETQIKKAKKAEDEKICGMSEMEWRKIYLQASDDVQQASDEAKIWQGICNGSGSTLSFSCQNASIKRRKLEEAKYEYTKLERKAADCSVPIDWREYEK